MKLVEAFPGVWLSPTDIKTIYVIRKLDHIKENKKVFKYCATIKTGEETFYGDEFDTPAEARKSVEPIIQRLNAYRD